MTNSTESSRQLEWLIVGLSGIFAVFGAIAFALRAQHGSTAAVEVTLPIAPLLSVSRPLTAKTNPRVILIEFMDYECPPCKMLHAEIEACRQLEGVEVRVAQFPLEMHPTARSLAEIALLAPVPQFGGVHDHQMMLNSSEAKRYIVTRSRSLALDNTGIHNMLGDKIQHSIQEGKLYGVNSTPSVFLYSTVKRKLYKLQAFPDVRSAIKTIL